MRFTFFTQSLVSDWNHGNAHFLRGIMRALQQRGHDCRAMEPADGWSRRNLIEDCGPAAVEAFHATFPDLRSETYHGIDDLDRAVDGSDVVEPLLRFQDARGALSCAPTSGAQRECAPRWDAQRALDLFSDYTTDYPGGALIGQAHFYRGEALTELAQNAPAARAYLDSFSADPASEVAPRALYNLGLRLADLNQVSEACVTLGEVQVRFPDTDVSFDAGAERRALGCN